MFRIASCTCRPHPLPYWCRVLLVACVEVAAPMVATPASCVVLLASLVVLLAPWVVLVFCITEVFFFFKKLQTKVIELEMHFKINSCFHR